MSTIVTREIEYTTQDGKRFVGFFAAPQNEQVAAVLVAPEWWGRNDYVVQRAKQLAEQGYAAFAIDMYGDKKTTEQAAQANEWMTETFQQPNTIVERANAALSTLIAQPEVDATHIAAVGFCFGGKVVLDLARANAPLKAVATFHGNLSTQTPAQKGQVQAEVLVLHGEQDSMVTLDDVASLEKELQAADVTYEVIILPNAKHGFSNPLADERAKANGVDLAYNADAEKKGLAAMYALLARQLNP
ncbi:MAG: dienelactone hydrolase family protein [Acinetobacter sp.]